MLPIAILAGGLATRLRPATETIPKSLIEINGEPFLGHQLRLLRRAGLQRVVVCIGYLGDRIREFAGDGGKFGLDLIYSEDGPALRGTAGAVRGALEVLGDEFLVLYGDSYLPCDYAAVEQAFLSSGQPGLMTVFRNRNQWETSNVELVDGRIIAYDKKAPSPRMEYVDYGLSAFHRSAFVSGEEEPDLASVFQRLIRQRNLAGFEVQQRFYEVGSWDGIRALQAHLKIESTASL